MHYLDEKQLALMEAAAKVKDCFSDDGTAPKHLIKQILDAGFLHKTKSRKVTYLFTDAGIIAVALWNSLHQLQRRHDDLKTLIRALNTPKPRREPRMRFSETESCGPLWR